MAKSKTSGLEDKQEMFCREYLKDLNGTQAAIRAGYSAKTAHSIANENLIKPEIQNFIQKLKSERAERCEITADMVLNELAKIGFSDVTEFLNDDLELKTLSKIDENKRGAIQSIQKDVTQAGLSTTTSTKFKLHDKLSALEKIAKHIGFYEKDNEQQNKVFHPAPSEERIKEIKKKLKNDY